MLGCRTRKDSLLVLSACEDEIPLRALGIPSESPLEDACSLRVATPEFRVEQAAKTQTCIAAINKSHTVGTRRQVMVQYRRTVVSTV